VRSSRISSTSHGRFPPWSIDVQTAHLIVKDNAGPMWSIYSDSGKSGLKETAMPTTRFARMTLAVFFVAGWLALFGAAIEPAQAQTVNPVPPPPPPVFNPSTPYTVPQSPEIPVSPSSGTPVSPSSETPAPQSPVTPVPPSSETTPSQQQAVPSTPVTSKAAKARGVRYSHRHRRLSGSRENDGAAEAIQCPCYFPGYARWYYPTPWSYRPACAWHRAWDGKWFHDCI
jgi:hypothetical protein